jgi:hypothetical protein
MEAPHTSIPELRPNPCSIIAVAKVKTIESVYIKRVTVYGLAELFRMKVMVVRHLVNGTLDQFLVACILRAR